MIDNLVESIFQVQRSEMLADDAREEDFSTQFSRLDLQNRDLE